MAARPGAAAGRSRPIRAGSPSRPTADSWRWSCSPAVVHLIDAATGRTLARLQDPDSDRARWLGFTRRRRPAGGGRRVFQGDPRLGPAARSPGSSPPSACATSRVVRSRPHEPDRADRPRTVEILADAVGVRGRCPASRRHAPRSIGIGGRRRRSRTAPSSATAWPGPT